MSFWGADYSWIEFIGSAIAAFVGVLGAIFAAWMQVRRQEGLSAKEMREQLTVQAAKDLTSSMVALDHALSRAWRERGLPAGAVAFDDYLAAITAARPMLFHVGLWPLAQSLRFDADSFLRSWRMVEEEIGEPLHDPDPAGGTTGDAEFKHDWLRGHTRALASTAPSKDVELGWRRDAPIWVGWENCIAVALNELSEQTLAGGRETPRGQQVESLAWWNEAAHSTAESWRAIPDHEESR